MSNANRIAAQKILKRICCVEIFPATQASICSITLARINKLSNLPHIQQLILGSDTHDNEYANIAGIADAITTATKAYNRNITEKIDTVFAGLKEEIFGDENPEIDHKEFTKITTVESLEAAQKAKTGGLSHRDSSLGEMRGHKLRNEFANFITKNPGKNFSDFLRQSLPYPITPNIFEFIFNPQGTENQEYDLLSVHHIANRDILREYIAWRAKPLQQNTTLTIATAADPSTTEER